MDTQGFLYTARMSNSLAKEVPEEYWDKQLIDEVGTLRELFKHIIRVRDVYTDGLRAGFIEFPGQMPSDEENIVDELERSMIDLFNELAKERVDKIQMNGQSLTLMETLTTAVHHEGIHQGQYYVALRHAGIDRPKQWETDWGM
ncbi:damage-inducible protein DinB [Halalkalibacillus sediminis]|uniref:Damage-inducible protein DinB n=1 Tax=Halalkalibacillus sediminis TaxID=2018042 RepID=A0A2I0QR95_9BACI|nr:DinB family protein [Halalkalibacillus sediminis]PKR76854.1 damage-inducible protein DinB [Halalkalibacillus sediminis]